ncbi:hypothetical protein HUJ04_008126 [Dendroctonus ponderosae]|nr:hypothetical protein HUJ04_008126 [Dendroctonus ponderosae]
MAEERLIEIVRGHQELYDTKHTNYMKAKLKTRIWCDIAKELKLKDSEEVKNMWMKLRGSYRDAERRKRKSLRSGAAPQKIKPWRFQKQIDNDSPLLSVAETLSQSMEMTCEDDGSAQPDSEEFYVTDSVTSDGESSRGPETSLPPVINYTPVVRRITSKQDPYEMLKKSMLARKRRMCLNVIGESSQHPHFDDVKTRLGSVGMTSNLTLSLPEKTQCQLGR